jgi:phosphatidylglycerol---prolipoprotein diacylglyceryl transferase
MGGKILGEKPLLLTMLAEATAYTNFDDLGLINQVAIPIPFTDIELPIRFYSLAYIIGIFAAYWLTKKMIRQPGAPMAERHVDDLLFWAMLGVILGGRLGYVLFYNLDNYVADPVSIIRLWDGGMSFHGGVVGVTLAILYIARKEGLSFLRVCDYIACTVPIGMLLGRLANFINGELWGRVTDVPWAIVFPLSGTLDPRHPSQLYQAGLEGLFMLLLMSFLFWRTKARYNPGMLVGIFAAGMGASRFINEFFREPDAQLAAFAQATGLSMGQWLTIPMILVGLWLAWSAKGRRQRIEPFAGADSVA